MGGEWVDLQRKDLKHNIHQPKKGLGYTIIAYPCLPCAYLCNYLYLYWKGLCPKCLVPQGSAEEKSTERL